MNKRIVTLGACALTLATLMASPASAGGKLHLYNWGEYINPEVIDKFSKEFDVNVSLDTYSTNEEMLAKIQAGATGYDLIWPSVHMNDILLKLDLLEKTNINESPGFKNIDRASLRSLEDPESEYCLPYAWGSVGIFFNKQLVPDLKSWKDFFEYGEQNPGMITMLDDLRETIGVGLILDGKSVNSRDSKEINAAADFILSQKKNIGAFTYDIAMVSAGDIGAMHYYVGAVLNVLQEPDKLGYIIPEEGGTLYQENICMLKTAPNMVNARMFMEFMMRPDISALNTVRLTNGSVNKAAIPLLPDELKNHPAINPSADVMSKLQIFEDIGKDIRVYDRAWTRVKTN